MTYTPQPTQTAGDQAQVVTTDQITRELLKLLLTEQRITNLHLAQVSGEDFKSEDTKS